tara:strand:+ start:12222 stop:13217 length:996 start_codon:yes stop_codon:yes gene_type:complete
MTTRPFITGNTKLYEEQTEALPEGEPITPELDLLKTVEELEQSEERTNKTLSLNEIFTRYIDKSGKSKALPTEWHCGWDSEKHYLNYDRSRGGGCGLFLLNSQRVADMKSWGYNQMQIGSAWCRCNEKNEIIARTRRQATVESNLPKYAQNQIEPTLFNFKADNNENLKEAMRKATNFCGLEGTRLLTYSGGVGVGKTHLLEGIGRAFLQADRSVRYENYSDFLEYVNSIKNREAELFFYEKTYEDFVRYVDLLILDEVMPSTDFQRKAVFDVVESRLREPYLYTVIATNLPVEDMKADLGKRLHSRVFQNQNKADVWEIKSVDYRMKTNY